jgi:hypothetical protein
LTKELLRQGETGLNPLIWYQNPNKNRFLIKYRVLVAIIKILNTKIGLFVFVARLSKQLKYEQE